jgi:hypothetical protein
MEPRPPDVERRKAVRLPPRPGEARWHGDAADRWLRPGLRISEFPVLRGWGFFLRFLKTFEVLFFKVLQLLDLYRPQKSIVAIPSLATRRHTVLQAVVYNGTQEEVLGYRPRRLIHRILKGLPDMEMYERLRLHLAIGENTARTVDVSTETRGFVNVQLPWQLPWRCPRSAWLRIQPLGVETLVGRVQLGDYEVLSQPVFFLTERVPFIVISDIDDTIKDSNIAETTTIRSIVRSVFRGHYYRYDAIGGMADLYRELAARGALIVYLTSTPYQLAPFLLKFLRENGFPDGPVFLRWLGYGRFSHKWRVLHRILSNVGRQRCALIGDSGEEDLQIYRRLCATALFRERVDRILIRHVPGTPRYRTEDPRELYYSDIAELRRQLDFILSAPLVN